MENATLLILVVDDSKAMRTILMKKLQDLGSFEIYEAYNGTDALCRISEVQSANKSIDVIISDWNMPGMSGLKFLIYF